MNTITNKAISIGMLLVGSLLVGFSMGQWLAPLAAWIGPVLIMRYYRDHKVGRGYLFVLAAYILATAIGFMGPWLGGPPRPMVPFLIFLYPHLWSLPYLADRLIYKRLPGFQSTFAYPLAAATLEFAFIHVNPLGTWGASGFTQYGNLPLMQLASVTGMIGITFIMGWFASVANWVWDNQERRSELRKGLAGFGTVLVAVFLFGFLRLNLTPLSGTPETVRVAAITAQSISVVFEFANGLDTSDMDAYKQEIGQFLQLKHDLYFEKTVQEAQAGAKIILWPESAGTVLELSGESELIARAQEVADQYDIYLVLPIYVTYPNGQLGENKLVLINPAGTIEFEHIKYGGHILEPYIVKGEAKLQSAETPFGVFSAVICYDLDFPAVVQQAGLEGAGLMLVPAHDWRTIDPIHSYMAVFRAIENGMSLVRQTDEGLSIAVDPYGRVLAQTDFFGATDRTLVVQVPVRHIHHVRTLF